jgi:dissimilatory sulfite reductase (desulfoviridin) alpha/beta subunit
MSVSLHGCPAGCGFDCGVWEYTDLRLIGRRSGTPVIDQWLLALSPEPGALARLCPAGALRLSDAPDRILDLDGTLCLRCGACLAADPSFSWPSPQGSYLALELSGRKAAAPRGYLAPRLLVRREDDAERLFRKIASLAAIFLERARGGEILGDFMAREGLMGFFGEGGADGD